MVRKVLRWFTFLIAAAVGLSSAVVWVRSYSTFDLFAWSGNTALWPDGKTTAVPRGSDLVGRWWYREGKYPVMRIGGLQIRLAAGKVRVVRVLNNFRMDDWTGAQWYGSVRNAPDAEHQDGLTHESATPESPRGQDIGRPLRHNLERVADFDHLGIEYHHSRTPSFRIAYTSDVREFALPLWMPLALALLVACAVAPLRLRRRPRGLCRNCGYDLRASPDRCPECGTSTEHRAGPPPLTTSAADSSDHPTAN